MTDDYRTRVAAAIAAWARDYPIASWHLAQGGTADRLAKAWGEQAARAALAVRDEELERAVAHDRQPYPTQWAYDQACAALEQHRARADQAEQQRDELRAELDRRITADAEALADQTLLKGLTVKDGAVNLEVIPPREIAALWVHCAVGMLGVAPNYCETRVDMPTVSMEISPAGTYDRYALIVQRVGKLTPHEARQQAEARADQAEAAIARVRALHQPEEVTFARGPHPGTGETGTIRYSETCCSACNGGDYSPPERWPCPTIRALDGEDPDHG